MTWIVGTATIFGYGIGISDVRVTLGDSSERDCVQKIYKVGNSIAAGFAGSVAIGFGMIDRLTELLACDDPNLAWDPMAVAGWWPQYAREVFNGFSQEERDLESHVILIGAHPTEHNGNPGCPKSYVYSFCSPDFGAVTAPPPEVTAIGCGTHSEPCRAAIESISKDHEARFNITKGEQSCPGGMATLLGIRLTLLLQETQPRGISSHLHSCWVYRDKVVIAPNNYASVGRWKTLSLGVEAAEKDLREANQGRGSTLVSPGMNAFQMPAVAKSWKELKQLLQASGLPVAQAIA
jgi:hypothetical protein